MMVMVVVMADFAGINDEPYNGQLRKRPSDVGFHGNSRERDADESMTNTRDDVAQRAGPNLHKSIDSRATEASF